ncbi:hypothetical protein CQ06_05325 [Ralstonia solanacearum]|nr:hypothetical protein CQ06_05325 [Ralstonia solanacearum]
MRRHVGQHGGRTGRGREPIAEHRGGVARQPVRLRRRRHGLRCAHLDGRQRVPAGGIVGHGHEAGPVALVHAGIQRDRDGGAARQRGACLLGAGHQRIDGHHRQAGAEGQALRHAARGPQAGERTGADAKRDSRAVAERDAGFGQQFARGGQHTAAGTRAGVFVAEQRAHAVTEGNGTEFGGGIESKDPRHGGIVPAGAPPGRACRRQARAKTEDILEFKRLGWRKRGAIIAGPSFSSREPP